jgi:8-oxo-dGTP pyrophosphatase MutT (NUDIX family)
MPAPCANCTRKPISARSSGSARSTQKWFALRFTGDESEIDIARPAGGAHEPEFVGWRWEPMQNLPALVVPFKRPVYARVVAEFARFAHPPASAAG